MSTQTPSLHAILEKLRQREEQFDGYDAQVTWDIHSPGQSSSIFNYTGRFIRSGGKRHIEVEQRCFFEPKNGRPEHHLFTFDGQTARLLYRESQRGRVFHDFDAVLSPTQYYGPEMLGITIPDTGGRRLSTMLEGDSVPVTNSIKLPKTVSMLPGQEIDHEPVLPVEVTIMVGTSRGEILTVYLSGSYDYAALRLEHTFVRNGQRELMSRLSMSSIRQLKPGLWFPTTGRREIFQGKPEVQQTTTYRITQITWPASFADDLFTISFPPGTHVWDEITGRDFHVDGSTTP